MTRTEAIQAGEKLLSSIAIDGEVATISSRNPQAIVLTLSTPPTPCQHEEIRDAFEKAFMGTGLEGVPVIIMPAGSKLEIIDKLE